MAIQLKTIDAKDPQLRDVQSNTAEAVRALDAKGAPPVGVLPVTSSQKLVGNEDVVLVDASQAVGEIALILPNARQLQRILTVKVTKAGTNAIRIKAVDIPNTATPSIDEQASISIAAGLATALRIVSDGRNFWTC